MPRRIGRQTARRRRTFLRQWRESCRLTLETAAGQLDMSAAQLSRVERGQSPYTQDFLESAARAYKTDVPSLLTRDPTAPEAIWSIWDKAEPDERQLIVDIAKRITAKK